MIISEKLLSRTELDGFASMITCEARVAEALGSRVRLIEEPGPDQLMAEVKRRIQAGAWSDVATIDANYLRRTDAELKSGN